MAKFNRPYGVGLAYRLNLHREIMEHADEIDVLEIPSVDYITRMRKLAQDPLGDLLREAMETFPCAGHGINMSIGSVEPHDDVVMRQTRRFLDEFGIDDFSEHLAFHRMDGADVKSFMAMPFEEVSLRWLTLKYNQARAALGRPFGLENVSYLVNAQGCAMDEADFISELSRRTGCTILLDVTNVFNNASNHNYDPVEYIRRLPGEKIEQLHVAGGKYSSGRWLDSHNAPVMPQVWDLLHESLECTAAEMIFLEKDTKLLPYEKMMADVRKARDIFYQHRPSEPPPKDAPANDDLPAEVPTPDPDDPEFADLKSYQRAVLAQITDPEFRGRVDEDPDFVQQRYPMAPDWQQRWQSCNQFEIEEYASTWPRMKQFQEGMDDAQKRLEWQMWAQQEAAVN